MITRKRSHYNRRFRNYCEKQAQLDREYADECLEDSSEGLEDGYIDEYVRSFDGGEGDD